MKWYWSVGLSLVTALMATRGHAADQVQPVKDPNGATLAVVVACDTCKTGSARKGTPCASGAEEGFLNGQPCGQCLVTANAQQAFTYPYDIHIVGKLVDADGKPVKDRFVKMFTPLGWSMRSRTAEDGTFHFIMGATAPRKSQTPVLTDLGPHSDTAKDTPYYAFYLLPDAYQACPAGAAAPASKKPAKKKP
jgi:hypothetical protein